ncbi:MAG: hypothetical protein AAF618_08295 [Pseudomonadota bacterium]
MLGQPKTRLLVIAALAAALMLAVLPLWVAAVLLATGALLATMMGATYRPKDRMYLVDQATLDRTVGAVERNGTTLTFSVKNGFDRPMGTVALTASLVSTSLAPQPVPLPDIWGSALAQGEERIVSLDASPETDLGVALSRLESDDNVTALEIRIAFEEAAIYRRITRPKPEEAA